MMGDLLIARPLLIVATVIGAGLFVIASPFAAAGGNPGATGKALVVDPGKAAFVRCLGLYHQWLRQARLIGAGSHQIQRRIRPERR